MTRRVFLAYKSGLRTGRGERAPSARPATASPPNPPSRQRAPAARLQCPRRHRDSRSARLTAARVLTECLPHTRGAGRRQVLLRTSHLLQGRRHSHGSDRLCPPPARSALRRLGPCFSALPLAVAAPSGLEEPGSSAVTQPLHGLYFLRRNQALRTPAKRALH